MRRGQKSEIQSQFEADKVVVRWDREPFDGEEIYTVCEIKPGCAYWQIYLASTGNWVGYAMQYSYKYRGDGRKSLP